MRQMLLTTILLLCCWSTGVLAQTKPDSSELLRQLLALPAPTPRLANAPTEDQQPAEKAAKNKVPADDAPADEIREYFSRLKGTSDKAEPPPAIKQRLIDIFADNPGEMQELLPYLTLADAEAVKAAFDKFPDDSNTTYPRSQVRKWLVNNSNYFLNELLAQANKVKDDPRYGRVDKSEELKALAKVDWSTAEPLLQSLAETGQQRSAALAISLLYEHAAETGDASAENKLRTRLQAIASDRNSPGSARDTAIETLSVAQWSGRDDWYLSLLQDESLISLDDNHYLFSPLNTIFDSDPDKWIPIMTKMVGGPNRTLQQTAGSCLVRYVIGSPRRDAILPVLRWLSDPDWIPIHTSERAHFMQKMDEVEVPESVPGLIWIIENDESDARWAARTVAHYKDPRAIPALKKALLRSEEDDRGMILEGLFASGGVTEAEVIDALEQYAAQLMKPESREEVEQYFVPNGTKLPVPLSIGRFLATTRFTVPPEIVRAVLAHATRIRKQNPELSRQLLKIAQGWQSRDVELNIINRIAAGTADAETIAHSLDQRDELRKSLGVELQSLLRAGGIAQAIGSIMLDDDTLAQTILSSADQPAQIALLASARLTQTPLPISVVGPLMKSKNALLAQAAERYLLAEDSEEARALLWQRHPGEAFVTGWRENVQVFGDHDFDALGKKEEQLRSEVLKENGPVEIFALLSNSVEYHRVLRVYEDRAVYTFYEDPARYRERLVSKAELSAFKQFLTTAELEKLGPQIDFCYHSCWVSETVFLRKDHGRRVFRQQPFNGSTELVEQIDALGRGPGVRYRYAFESEIKGLEMLYADDQLNVMDIWQHDDEMRVFTQRTPTEAEVKERDKPEPEDQEVNEDTQRERSRRQAAFDKSLWSWRKFAVDKVTSAAAEPEGYLKLDETKFTLESDVAIQLLRDELDLKGLSGDTLIIARNFNGLWKQVVGSKLVRIKEGTYLNPVISPDGKWVVLSKTDDNWGQPNYIVRINLETGREFRVNVERADDLRPIAFLPLHGQMLLRRAKDDYYSSTAKPVGPARPEYYLLTPQTGETRVVTGEFAPLVQEGKRFLQATGKTDEFWAAIPDDSKDQTQVGRYNLKTFSFTSVLTIPHIQFNSMSMWVDEKRGKIYVAYKGQLISIPLQRLAATVGGN